MRKIDCIVLGRVLGMFRGKGVIVVSSNASSNERREINVCREKCYFEVPVVFF